MEIEISVDNEKCIPTRMHGEDAGLDLVYCSDEEIEIGAGESAILDTGLRASIPIGYVGLLYLRSSIGKKGLMLKNAVGVIDSGYHGNIKAMVYNYNHSASVIVKPYERFCQLVIQPVAYVSTRVVDELHATDRGEGGFGSTGEH